jgi:hypothetical protein
MEKKDPFSELKKMLSGVPKASEWRDEFTTYINNGYSPEAAYHKVLDRYSNEIRIKRPWERRP